jgi:predicted transcriptional regulator
MKQAKQPRHALYVKLPDPTLKTRLEMAAAILDRPVSYVVRQAAEEKLAQMAKKHPELAAA